MAVWPPSLPNLVNVTGFEEKFANQVIRTQMEVGPSKVRRRSLSSPRDVSMVVTIDGAQKETLDTFFHSTLGGGSLSFDWTDPISQAPRSYRFKEPPSITAIGGFWFSAAMKLERLP